MSLRRSGRRAGARKSYTDDAFDVAGLEEEEDEEAIEKSISFKGKGRGKKRRRDDSDDEFDEAVAAAATENIPKEEEEDDEEEYGGGGDDFEDESVQSDDDGSDDDLEDSAELDVDASGPKRGSSRAVKRVSQRKEDLPIRSNPEDTRSRGTINPTEHVGKSTHIKLTFGLDNRDLLVATGATAQWFLGIDATFPTREALENVPDAAKYGVGASLGVSAADLEREATEAWDWYYDDDIGPRFRKRQRIEKIDVDRAQMFLHRPRKSSHKVIYGPSDNFSTIHLRQYESLNFGDAWKYRDETHRNGKDDPTVKKKTGKGKSKRKPEDPPASKLTEHKPPRIPDERRKNRYGWILNLSGKVPALGWAPNQNGLTQYLAVSVPISAEQEKQHDPPEPPAASRAFSSSPSYPGAVQIWSFDAENRKDGMIKTIDINKKPKLRQVLCMGFGHIRKINWCPFSRRKRDIEVDKDRDDLGLLACVFSDGQTRIFDVKVSKNTEVTEYLYVTSAMFTFMPSPTISSCMAWLSPTDIVIGCANGWVAVYNLLTSQATSKSEQHEDAPPPYMYIPIHSTYITKLETAYPQHPHIISTVSMDGNTKLVSLLDPTKDVVETHRQRLGTMQISYYPHLQAFVSNDENDFIRGLSVRRFYTTTSIGRLPSTVTTIANGSRWHPSVMAGCAEGSIYCFNPLRRFMHTKESHHHARWFLHEWAAGKDEDTPHTSRFTDDIEVGSISLIRTMKGDVRVLNGMMSITIYNQEQHVIAVDWNPNQQCAGWAAAGMGSGLIRVEDLAMFH